MYIDGILVFIKGEKRAPLQKVREVLEVLYKANLQLKADICQIACTKTEWLGYDLSGEGVTPVNSEVQGNPERIRPGNFKDLR